MQIPEGEFEGYIFDHDGTLSLSMHVHFDGWINAFKKNGGDFEFTRQIAQSYAGIGMHDTVRILNERFDCNMNPEQVVSDQESYFFANLDKVLNQSLISHVNVTAKERQYQSHLEAYVKL